MKRFIFSLMSLFTTLLSLAFALSVAQAQSAAGPDEAGPGTVIPAPTGLNTSNVTAVSVNLSWTAPDTDVTITSYTVEYRRENETTFVPIGDSTTTSPDIITTSVKINLQSNTSYVLRVRAESDEGSGDWATISAKTLALVLLDGSVLPPPSDVTASDLTSSSFKLSWTPPPTFGITRYEVRYRRSEDGDNDFTGPTSTSVSEITLDALKPDTAYKVQIRTFNEYGYSAWSSEFSVTTLQVSGADAVPSLGSTEIGQLGALLTYDTVIFNELYNGADDAMDWLELRNVSGADLSLDDWQLTIRTGGDTVMVPFPAGTVIPAGEVLLLANMEPVGTSEASILSVVSETFILPQADFALILRSPTAFGDIAGNYVEGEAERPETVPALTVGVAWTRALPIGFGYRASAWMESTAEDGLGTPGYRRSVSADLNADGVVNILDLVLVASKFGTTDTTADLNADGTVDIGDLLFVANAWGSVAGAPAAGTVNTWLHLARQNAESVAATSIPEGFSYTRGIQVLEQLTRASVPETTALLANYPNPFNPETWIPYQLAKATEVTVTIYAFNGSAVRTLALGHQDAGMYKNRSQAAYWDGKNAFGEPVASGIYFYTLTAGEFTATRKMLILK